MCSGKSVELTVEHWYQGFLVHTYEKCSLLSSTTANTHWSLSITSINNPCLKTTQPVEDLIQQAVSITSVSLASFLVGHKVKYVSPALLSPTPTHLLCEQGHQSGEVQFSVYFERSSIFMAVVVRCVTSHHNRLYQYIISHCGEVVRVAAFILMITTHSPTTTSSPASPTMACTKQTACKFIGGKAPRKQLITIPTHQTVLLHAFLSVL